jgi:hypothetical protein
MPIPVSETANSTKLLPLLTLRAAMIDHHNGGVRCHFRPIAEARAGPCSLHRQAREHRQDYGEVVRRREQRRCVEGVHMPSLAQAVAERSRH